LLSITRDTLTFQPACSFLTKIFKDCGYFGNRNLIQSTENGTGEFFPIVATHITSSAQDARRWRDDDWKRADQLGHGVGMERAGSTKRDQGKVPWIIAALHGHKAESAVHVLIDDIKNALGRTVDIQTELASDAFHCGFGRLFVQHHFSTQ